MIRLANGSALLGAERVLATVSVNFSVEVSLLNISVMTSGSGCIDEPSPNYGLKCFMCLMRSTPLFPLSVGRISQTISRSRMTVIPSLGGLIEKSVDVVALTDFWFG